MSTWVLRAGHSRVLRRPELESVLFLVRRDVASTFRDWVGGIRSLDPLRMLAPGAPGFEVVRFYKPFRAFRHGREAALRRAEARMWELLGG